MQIRWRKKDPSQKMATSKKKIDDKNQVRPFAFIASVSFISLVLSFFYISRFMFAAACLMCAYGAILNSMHTSFKQHNDLLDFRYLRNHSSLNHECHMNDVRKEKRKK